ncbi:MarR family winged helix-turn-helix transcriptional regulator [Microbispora sp. NPDC049125]|uniref:MarR family winged helix-turn-helix transcriptional regulator n=1 Tax=Microbispora sp. NPDC049125 TaxID=3154929 RepID=UPI003466E1E9
MGDAVDRIVDQWREQRPDLDLSAMATFARLSQVAAQVTAIVAEVLARHGLRGGEFDVLAALRRSGPPHILIPSELSAVLMMSRAGMTNRIDRLEAAGLVERHLDPADRRSFQISMTEHGRNVVDAAVTEYAPKLSHILSGLSDEDRQSLDRALRALLGAIPSTPDQIH